MAIMTKWNNVKPMVSLVAFVVMIFLGGFATVTTWYGANAREPAFFNGMIDGLAGFVASRVSFPHYSIIVLGPGFALLTFIVSTLAYLVFLTSIVTRLSLTSCLSALGAIHIFLSGSMALFTRYVFPARSSLTFLTLLLQAIRVGAVLIERFFCFALLAMTASLHRLLQQRNTPGDWLPVVVTHRVTAEGAKGQYSRYSIVGQAIRCVTWILYHIHRE